MDTTKVLLGFEDEPITEKHKLSCMVDKIGGTPDWPESVHLTNPLCRLCGRTSLLVCQLYAPLAGSLHHRTLYIFACINPGCWNLSDSWVCLRCQWLDTSCVPSETPPTTATRAGTTDWCSGADEWGADDRENGNVMPSPEWSSEDDDAVAFQLAGLTLDECNANAEGKTRSPGATAEIEGSEGEVVSIDTPVQPGGNLLSVLQEVTGACVPEGVVPQFQGFFLATGEEEGEGECCAGEHERELLARYNTASAEETTGGQEGYETDRPLHGDAMCYRFLLRLRRHPHQLLRYYAGAPPLLLSPLEEVPHCCVHCHGPVACELQLLPTLLYRLRLVGSTAQHLEFGTVLVWSCLHCCWTENDCSRQEVVVLQSEHV